MKLERTTEFVIVSGWVIMVLCCLGLVGLDVYLLYIGQRVPDLADMAKLALGFVFGSLPPMIANLLLQKPTPAPTPKPP